MSDDTNSAEPARSWSRELPPGRGPFDYIVIGSGMGGMTAAALLARVGKRVLVLEQHYTPGGFTHMFKRPGYIWDVGVHAVGEVTDRSLPGRVLADLSGGALEWASLGKVYEEFHFPGGVRVDFGDNPMAFRAGLCETFPDEVEAIDKYLEKVREVAAGMRNYYLARTLPYGARHVADAVLARGTQRFLEMRTADVLAGLTDNPRLRTVLAAQWAYYGSPPSRSSFAMQALVTQHFKWGAYYPVGGSKRIADTLLATVAKAGGWTRIRADVEQILVEKGRAVGVRLAGGEEIRAPRVVSAAGVQSTINRLLPEEYRAADWGQSITTLSPAPAHLCLYLGFKGDIRKAGASGANKWFWDTWSCEPDEFDLGTLRDPKRAPVLYCSFPSLKDPTHDPGPEERHTGEVVTFVPWNWFSEFRGTRWHKRGADYDEIKARLQERLLSQFLEKMPALAPMVDHVELSTPVSTDHFVRPMSGSIYGIEPTPERFRNPWLRPRSPIGNLFFAGSEVSSVGVIGAMMGGVLAAASAEPIKAVSHLRPLFGR